MSSDVFYKFCGSSLWNSSLTWDTDHPRLTLCFQKTVLVWIPCIFLWLFAPLEIYYILHSKTRKVPWSILNISKMLVVICLIFVNIVEFASVVTATSQGVKVYPIDFWNPTIRVLTFIFILILILWNKVNGLRTSGIIFLFWFFMTVSEVPKFWTDFTISQVSKDEEFYTIMFRAHFVLVTVSLLLNVFSDSPPKVRLYPKSDKQCPYLCASFLSRLTFSWFNGMIWTGFKRPLTANDLWTMRPQDSGYNVIRQFNRYWGPVQEKFLKEQKGMKSNSEKKMKTVSVVWPLIKAFLPAASIGCFFRLTGDMCAFLSPFVLRLLIAFVTENQPVWRGYMYAVLLFLIAEVQTLFIMHSILHMYELGLRIRTALISAIYKKALKCSSSTRKGTTVGQIVNLMSVDSQRFYDVMPYLNLMWTAPVIIAVAFILLWESIGVAALAGLFVMLVILPVNSLVANLVKKYQTKQMLLKDERIKKMNEILAGIKVLKLYAWEPSFQEQILKIREQELQLLRKAALLNAATSFLWVCSPFLVGFVTFGVYILTDERNILDPQLVFYCLALINIMRVPIAMLPTLIQMTIIASVSLKRINTYLSADELDGTMVSHDQTNSAPLVISGGSFTWEPEENIPPTLKNINMTIDHGNLVAVVGAVGSGKSSLIAAFLGEIVKVSGYVNTKGRIAYVGQQAWIQNTTLRENILFGSNFDERKYNRVIEACALKLDLDMLPGGDMTEIGEKGINLSGGQKQRVSLARAVYNSAQIYFLDDPLSAVDAHVGKHIFDNVIGPNGLLRKTTRVLVTHAITYLPYVDMIYVMKDGSIPERGTYKELLKKKEEFAEFLMQHLSEELESNADIDLNIDQILGNDSELRSKFDRQMSTTMAAKSSLHVRFSMRQDSIISGVSLESNIAEEVNEDESDAVEKIIEVEKSETGNVKMKIYSHYFQAAGWIFVFLTILFDISSQLFSILTSLWLSHWTSDSSVNVNGAQDIGKRNLYLGIYGAIGSGQILSSVLGTFVLVFGTISASRWLHVTILTNIFHCPMSFFDTTPIGRIVNRFSKDMDTVDTLIPINCSSFISCLVQVIGILCVISYSTPFFMIIIVPIVLFYVFIQRFYLSTSRQLKRIESVSRSPIFSHFGETVTGAVTIRAYRAQGRFTSLNEQKVDENQMSLYPSMISNRWLGIRLESVGNMVIFFAAIFCVLYRDELEPGLAGVSINYALQVTAVLNFCVRMTSDLEANIVAVERIKEYAEVQQEAPWWLNKRPESSWPEKGRVEFREYQVRYREGLDLVLKGISFTVNGGEKIGIVGRTGAGKSSLTLCLFRILEAAGGSILIDGIDISKMGLNDLRSRLTIIPQDPILFSGTLRLNIDPSETYTDEAIWQCLTLSHLSNFVKSLPNGLDYEVTEGGDNLSVGQAQLLCLARALLRKTKLLILDEATAAVDLDTDDLIQRTIRTEFKDCTVLTIAHRLNTIMDSDRVIVLDKGYLMEYDTPSNLIKNKTTIFYGMAKDAGLVG